MSSALSGTDRTGGQRTPSWLPILKCRPGCLVQIIVVHCETNGLGTFPLSELGTDLLYVDRMVASSADLAMFFARARRTNWKCNLLWSSRERSLVVTLTVVHIICCTLNRTFDVSGGEVEQPVEWRLRKDSYEDQDCA